MTIRNPLTKERLCYVDYFIIGAGILLLAAGRPTGAMTLWIAFFGLDLYMSHRRKCEGRALY